MSSYLRRVLNTSIFAFINKHRKYVLMSIDTAIAILSYLIPYIISGIHPQKIQWFKEQFLVFTVIYITTFICMGVYKNILRYAGIEEIFNCLKASFIGNGIFLIVSIILNLQLRYYVLPVVFIVSSFCTIAMRIVYRAAQIIINRKTINTKEPENVMIIGAGQATALLLKELRTNNPSNLLVNCIIDDDKTKINRDIKNVPVVGNTNLIAEMAIKYDVKTIIISIPSIDMENKKRILDICSKTKCKLKILPYMHNLISFEEQQNLVNKVRDVQVEDLLGREPITFDCELTKKYIKNKTVLVTGGGGSIGSELCRQIAPHSPQKLIILDIYENNAYEIQQELIRQYGDKLNMEVEIASVRDKNKLEKLFQTENIDIVFHAAAHKHVPLMEHNPEEAIKNNIIGTYNTASLADKYGANKFVLISTDKAVNPTNIMGATKRVCEMIVQSLNKHSRTEYVAVRFGNVLGSNGSVIPLFKEQIKSGGPVTITHEEITRFFMTIPEAVQLVTRAASIARGGEIFVLDMGEPVKIKDLAYNLIRLSGLEPNKDIKIEYTGLRPGEKLYEELLITEESGQTKTSIDKVFIEQPTEFNEVELFESIKKLNEAAHSLDVEGIIKNIEKLVPTYKRTLNSIDELNEEIEKTENVFYNEREMKIMSAETA